MIKDLQNKQTRELETFTTSEYKIAAYLLHNISGIRFQIAASLGQRVDVSPMMVGHFHRCLGYAGLRVSMCCRKFCVMTTPWLLLYKILAHPREADCGALPADRVPVPSLHGLMIAARGFGHVHRFAFEELV